jgi:hypothetical protein
MISDFQEALIFISLLDCGRTRRSVISELAVASDCKGTKHHLTYFRGHANYFLSSCRIAYAAKASVGLRQALQWAIAQPK